MGLPELKSYFLSILYNHFHYSSICWCVGAQIPLDDAYLYRVFLDFQKRIAGSEQQAKLNNSQAGARVKNMQSKNVWCHLSLPLYSIQIGCYKDLCLFLWNGPTYKMIHKLTKLLSLSCLFSSMVSWGHVNICRPPEWSLWHTHLTTGKRATSS